MVSILTLIGWVILFTLSLLSLWYGAMISYVLLEVGLKFWWAVFIVFTSFLPLGITLILAAYTRKVEKDV